jgi:hypothetical protein
MEEIRKNILIVCEGEGAEPNYFNHYRNILIDKKPDISIVIRPKPKNEEPVGPLILRKGARRRTLKQVLNEPNGDIVEPEYRTQPTKYVREAQLSLEDGTFDEVWAVYDKDGHPNHKEAFDLSLNQINGKFVHLGFTSIAFEYWILLHFERNNTSFQKALCRDGRPKREYRFCGIHQYPNDCNGLKCVCGRIVGQNYLEYKNDKKDFDLNNYVLNVETAIINAIQIRKQYIGNPAPFYTLNPYTTIDRLVFKLIQLVSNDFEFFERDSIQYLDNILIEFNVNNNILNVRLSLIENQTYIINKGLICLINLKGELMDMNERIILNPENNFNEFTINLNNHLLFNPFYVGYKTSNNIICICEI